MAMPGYGTYGFDPNLPPEIDAEQQRIAKQQAIAEAMLQRGMTPLPTNQGPLHWTQGIAQVLNAYSGRRGVEEAAKSRTGLGAKYQQGLADEVKRIAALRQGTPTTENIVDEQANGGEGAPAQIVTPGRGDPKAAIEAALLSQYAPVRQMGALEHRTFENEQTRANDRAARLEERILTLDAAAQNAALAREERAARAAEAAALRRELAEMADRTRRDIAGQRFSVTVPPPVTIGRVQDPANPERMLEVDARTYKGGTLGAPGVIGISGRESDAQKREGKRQFNMQGIGATIQQAEDLLNGVVRSADGTITSPGKKPTGSGVGAVVDAVGGFFGRNPDGAVEAQQLKAVGAALTSKMPRMEGPQSDKDVALYKESAAEVGNPTVPIARRLAALDTVKQLWSKYERLNPDAFAGGGAPSGGGSAPRVVDW